MPLSSAALSLSGFTKSASPKISGHQASIHFLGTLRGFCLPKRASLNLPAPGAPRSVSLPRSSTVLLTPRAPSTSKTLARGWYDFGKIDTRYHFRKVDARGDNDSPREKLYGCGGEGKGSKRSS